MNAEELEFKSKLGRPAVYTYRFHEDKTRNLVILLPGQAYYKDAPLMWYSAMAAFQAGADTLNVEYGFHANKDLQPGSDEKSTLEELRSALQNFLSTHQYETIIMISKSVGTHFASEIGKIGNHDIKRHIFLTPLKDTIAFMQRSQEILVMVGEKDPLFREDDIRTVKEMANVQLITFPEANHLMEVKDNYGASIKIIEQVAQNCEAFVSRHIRGKT